MGRSRKDNIQWDKDKGKWYCRIDYSMPQQRKVYLSGDKGQSRWWYKAMALLVTDDPELGEQNHDEAEHRAKILENCESREGEMQLINSYIGIPEYVPEWTFEIAAHQLIEIMDVIHKQVTEEMINSWWYALDSDACDKLLIGWGFPERQIHKLRKWDKLKNKRPNPDWLKAYPEAEEVIWEAYLREKRVRERVAKAVIKKVVPTPSKQKLNACYPKWFELKGKSKKPPSDAYVGEVKSTMRQFVKVVGDKPINLLVKDDFECWREYLVEKQVEKGISQRTVDKQMANVRAVVKELRNIEWPWPEGVTEWLEFEFRKGDGSGR